MNKDIDVFGRFNRPYGSDHSGLFPEDEHTPRSSRKDLQWGRRLFHFITGTVVSSAYAMFLSHQELVYALGLIACLIYLLEQIRINYPQLHSYFLPLTKFFLRAEEQLKESSAIPYAMAILLTILSFPKMVAICSIFTLAIADPLSALVGISFGKHHWVKHKTLEGSAAFLLATFCCVFFPLYLHIGGDSLRISLLACTVAVLVSFFEMIPLKLDDNLTIPLFTAIILWILSSAIGLGHYLT